MLGRSLFVGQTVELTSIDAEKDAVIFSKWSELPNFNRRFNFGMFRLIPEYEMKKKLADQLKKAEEKRNAYLFGIRTKEEKSLIGFTRIVWILHTHQVGTIQIDFGTEEDLKKYGDEAMKMMLHYGFMEVSLHRIEATVPGYESELIALYERMGFLREVQRREAVFHSGRYWDEMVYALIKPEYKQKFVEEQK